MHYVMICLGMGLLATCGSPVSVEADSDSADTYADLRIAGAMRNVMWRGELDGIVALDSLQQPGTYAVGPLAGLRGEILLADGVPWVSRVAPDSSVTVTKMPEATAPFLVYARVREWRTVDLPSTVVDLPTLEHFVNEQTRTAKRPFCFRLVGTVDAARTHVQNLTPGSRVRSPPEAHAGQVKYALEDQPAEIVGFFSTEHAGVFTHHDTYLHLHLLTDDRTHLGHVDALTLRPSRLKLYLPVR